MKHAVLPFRIALAIAALISGLFFIYLSVDVSHSRPSLDRTFGERGIALARPDLGSSTTESSRALVETNDGRILVVGNDDEYNSESRLQERSLLIGRLTSDGRLDRSFGTSGFIYGRKLPFTGTRMDRFGYGQDLAITSRGKILSTGPMIPLGSSLISDIWIRDCAFLASFLPGGAINRSFANDGRSKQCLHRVPRNPSGPTINQHAGLEPRSIDVTGNGRIVIGGQVLGSGRSTGAFLARFHADGKLDRTFVGDRRTRTGERGIVRILKGIRNGETNDVIALRRRESLAVGTVAGNFLVAKLKESGGLDSSFSNKGIFNRDLDGSRNCWCSIATGAAIDDRGRILVAGKFARSDRGLDYPKLLVVRFHRNGHLDKSFGQGGVVKPQIPGFFDATSIVVQRGGMVISGGYTRPKGSREFALVRLNGGGTLDRGFFKRGVFAPGTRELGNTATDVILDRKGRLLASGTGSQHFSVVRIKPGR